ncbi:MAG TPA: cytochrome c oxidase subunit 3 [Acidimicrobiales bacterium]|nr:cytochrome c oxidase subunit 3 [Acidimicrobiales bacterium]
MTEKASPAGEGPAGHSSVLTVGTVVWLASELMFFSGLFAAYFTLRALSREEWPPHGVELEPVVAGGFTVALVASSGTIQLGVRALARGDRRRFRLWVVLTLVLAAVFLANQAREYAEASFSVSSHAYGSAFYLTTGFHGLHVLGGMLAMVVLVGRAANPSFGADETPAVEVVSYYWHFVDVVWIALFATIYVLQ